MILMMVMVQGCTVVAGVASGYRRGVTLEWDSAGNDGVAAVVAAAQIDGVGVIAVVAGGGESATTANYDIVVVLKASVVVVVVVDYDASVAGGAADCARLGSAASGDNVMQLGWIGQVLLQD